MTEDSKTAAADSELVVGAPDPAEEEPSSPTWANEAKHADSAVGEANANASAPANDDGAPGGDYADADDNTRALDADDDAREVESGGAEDAGDAADVGTESDVTTLRRQRDEFQDLLLRKAAELDNVRKRADRERLELQQSAAADLLSDLLPIVDDLERALAVTPESTSVTSYREGVELIQKHLMEVLEKRGVTAIEALGADFDPNYHQAVAVDTSEGHSDGEVTAELRRGYTVRGRLLRAAMVRVAKA